MLYSDHFSIVSLFTIGVASCYFSNMMGKPSDSQGFCNWRGMYSKRILANFVDFPAVVHFSWHPILPPIAMPLLLRLYVELSWWSEQHSFDSTHLGYLSGVLKRLTPELKNHLFTFSHSMKKVVSYLILPFPYFSGLQDAFSTRVKAVCLWCIFLSSPK